MSRKKRALARAIRVVLGFQQEVEAVGVYAFERLQTAEKQQMSEQTKRPAEPELTGIEAA